MKTKRFKTVAKKDSKKPLHVLPTMFIKGEFYWITKLDKDFVLVSGKFKNSLGGTETKEQGIMKSICKEHLMYIDGNEKKIYPKYVQGFDENNKEIKKLYSLYKQHKNDPLGTQLYHDVGAPGIGHSEEVITKITDEAIYGVEIFNNVRIGEINDFY